MRFERLKDSEAKQQFRLYWWMGKTNIDNYLTKHHPFAHHQNVRAEFLMRVADLQTMRDSCSKQMTANLGHLSQNAARVCNTLCMLVNLNVPYKRMCGHTSLMG